MGNAYTVSGGDLSGAWHNPAALAGLDVSLVTAFYDRRLAGDHHGGLMASYPLGGGSLSGHFVCYSSGDVDLVQTDGETRTVTAQTDCVIGISYGTKLGASLGTGATVKVMRSTLAEEFTANSVSCDAGLVWDLIEDRLGLGVSLRNLGPDFAYDNADETLPWSAGFGIACRRPLGGDSVVGALDIVKTGDEDLKQHVGFEYRFGEGLALRAGYRFGYDSMGLTVGLGVCVGGLRLDHGVGLVETFDDIHLTQMSYGF
jgi:hypothetical protein